MSRGPGGGVKSWGDGKQRWNGGGGGGVGVGSGSLKLDEGGAVAAARVWAYTVWEEEGCSSYTQNPSQTHSNPRKGLFLLHACFCFSPIKLFRADSGP